MTEHRPLDALHAIRNVELEMARRVEAATLAADETVRTARVRERAEFAGAEERGRAEAARRLAEAIAIAEADAAEIRRSGARRVTELESSVAGRLEDVVDELVDLVFAPPLEEGK